LTFPLPVSIAGPSAMNALAHAVELVAKGPAMAPALSEGPAQHLGNPRAAMLPIGVVALIGLAITLRFGG
jgi:hypothetical protein